MTYPASLPRLLGCHRNRRCDVPRAPDRRPWLHNQRREAIVEDGDWLNKMLPRRPYFCVLSTVYVTVLLAQVAFSPCLVGLGGGPGGREWISGSVVASAGISLTVEFHVLSTKPVTGWASYENATGSRFHGAVLECRVFSPSECAIVGRVDVSTYSEPYFLIEARTPSAVREPVSGGVRVRLFKSRPVCELSGSFPGEIRSGTVDIRDFSMDDSCTQIPCGVAGDWALRSLRESSRLLTLGLALLLWVVAGTLCQLLIGRVTVSTFMSLLLSITGTVGLLGFRSGSSSYATTNGAALLIAAGIVTLCQHSMYSRQKEVTARSMTISWDAAGFMLGVALTVPILVCLAVAK